ncbi:hypothetical protein RS130_08200 [Paraglaciecola aquimarina]|uniref:Cohesin domain-containing protein n=1 Tax=Paraglaciecola aquimarina TaxID=1235557 RepID=A0ABU3SV55_9ALTE|nr:hypothetical protein [Paraglaciecola aquimarina]MDU0353910.1 hypothetical protein [Paraglaciecola aquimarina]
MKRLLAILTLFVGLNVQAGIISLNISDENVKLDDSVLVTLSGSGFDPFDSLSLDIEFDTSVFKFDALSVEGDLLNAAPLIFEVTEQMFGVALTFVDFVPFAGGNFTLATFNLTANAVGSTHFVLTNAIASDFLSGPVQADVVSRSASAAVVSAPATVSLFIIALLSLVIFRARN